MIRKSTTVWTNTPYFIVTAATSPSASCNVMARSEKSTPPNARPIGGISTSATKEETILPKAPPSTIPTAISTTLPRIAKDLNSDIIDMIVPRFCMERPVLF